MNYIEKYNPQIEWQKISKILITQVRPDLRSK